MSTLATNHQPPTVAPPLRLRLSLPTATLIDPRRIYPRSGDRRIHTCLHNSPSALKRLRVVASAVQRHAHKAGDGIGSREAAGSRRRRRWREQRGRARRTQSHSHMRFWSAPASGAQGSGSVAFAPRPTCLQQSGGNKFQYMRPFSLSVALRAVARRTHNRWFNVTPRRHGRRARGRPSGTRRSKHSL